MSQQKPPNPPNHKTVPDNGKHASASGTVEHPEAEQEQEEPEEEGGYFIPHSRLALFDTYTLSKLLIAVLQIRDVELDDALKRRLSGSLGVGMREMMAQLTRESKEREKQQAGK